MTSCLSFLLNQTSRIRYTPKRAKQVENTAALSPRFLNFVNTVEKSIEFGGTKKDDAKSDRCVHKHWVYWRLVRGPG